MYKKIASFMLCVITVFICCGCADVNYSLIINSNGSVAQSVIVNLKEADLSLAGYDITEVQQKIVTNSRNIFQNLITNFSDRTDISSELKATVLSKVQFGTEIKAEYVVTQLLFENITVYKYFYGSLPSSDEAEDDTTLEEHIFYAKNVSTNTTVFYDLATSQLANAWMQEFGNQFNLSDVNYSFSYGTPYQHLYSDANEITYSNDVKIHTWNFSSEELNNSIQTYTISYKTYNWYFLALILTFLFILVLLIVGVLKKHKKQ